MRSPFFRKTFPIRKLPDRQGVKKAHHLGVKDFVLKAGRSTEAATFRRLIKKFPKQGTRIYKVSQQKGLRKVQSLSNRLGVTGLGAGKSIRTIKKFKPSKARPFHRRGKDFPDLADDTTIGGVKAYADMPPIKRRASAEASFTKHSWGFGDKPIPELAPHLHAGKKHFGRIYSKPGSKGYKALSKKKLKF